MLTKEHPRGVVLYAPSNKDYCEVVQSSEDTTENESENQEDKVEEDSSTNETFEDIKIPNIWGKGDSDEEITWK